MNIPNIITSQSKNQIPPSEIPLGTIFPARMIEEMTIFLYQLTSQGLFTFCFRSEWESLGLGPANLSTLGLDSTKSTSRGVLPKRTFANLVLLNSRVV